MFFFGIVSNQSLKNFLKYNNFEEETKKKKNEICHESSSFLFRKRKEKKEQKIDYKSHL